MMKRIFAVLLALAMLLSAAAVFAEVADEEQESNYVPSNTLLATINGEEIKEDNEILQSYVTNYLGQVDVSIPGVWDLVRMYAMDNTLLEILVTARANAVYTAEEQAAMIKTEWESILDAQMEQSYGITADSSEEDKTAARADVLSNLEANGWTEEIFSQTYGSQIVLSAYAEQEKAALVNELGITVTDEEIRQAFEERANEDKEAYASEISMYEFYTMYYGVESYYFPEGYRGVTHILLKVDQALLDNWTDLAARLEESASGTDEAETTEGTETTEGSEPQVPVTPEMVEEARQAILDSVKDKIEAIQAAFAAGTSFEELIAQYGEDPGMQVTENLKNGYSVHADSIMYDPAFTAGAMSIDSVGGISEPVIGQKGVHIIYYLRDIPGGPVEMTEAMRAELEETIRQDKESAAFTDLLEKWLSEADITYTEEGENWHLTQEKLDAAQALQQQAVEAEAAE